MINNVVLVGRLTRAVDLRYTSNGTAYASFSIAIDRRYQNQNGERETDFINCGVKLQKTLRISLVKALQQELKDVFKLVAMITNKAKKFM